eukprot:6173370-Pleurochrysis_carterae.AAC.1
MFEMYPGIYGRSSSWFWQLSMSNILVTNGKCPRYIPPEQKAALSNLAKIWNTFFCILPTFLGKRSKYMSFISRPAKDETERACRAHQTRDNHTLLLARIFMKWQCAFCHDCLINSTGSSLSFKHLHCLKLASLEWNKAFAPQIWRVAGAMISRSLSGRDVLASPPTRIRSLLLSCGGR